MIKIIREIKIIFFSIMMICSYGIMSNAAQDPVLYSNAPKGIKNAAKDGLSVAVIRNLGADEHTALFLAGCKGEGKSLGIDVDTFITYGDDAKFEDVFSQILLGDYDGIIVSHGKDNAKELVQKAVNEGFPVVTFDTVVKIPGVTTTFQDDKALADESMGALVADFPDKTPKIIKMWIAGFPAMERREIIYKKYISQGKIQELETIGEVGDFSNVPGLNADAIGSLLIKYPKGEIDAIWGSWDAFAAGAYTALMENGRSEIKIYGIDVSNADLQMMQSKNSPWVMTAAADAQLVGVINMRILLKKIAGDATPSTFEIPATTIFQKDLSGSTTVETLANVYDTWGKTRSFNESWMNVIREKVGSN